MIQFRNGPAFSMMVALTLCGLRLTSLPAQIYTPLSSNGQFSNGLTSWNTSAVGASVTDQGPQSNSGLDQFGNMVFGGNKLQLDGASFVWQIVDVSAGTKYHQLNCQAYKKSLDGSTAGWAGYGVIYYDALWAVIDSFEKQIYTAGSTPETPFSPSSLGVRVPADAAHAIIWASNDAQNTQSSFDALILFDYAKASYNGGAGPYLGSTQPNFFVDTMGDLNKQSGLQFWSLEGCIDVGTGFIGDVGRACSIAQEVDVKVGKPYLATWYSDVVRSGDLPVANFGVDFFDAQWNRIDGSYRSLVDSNTTEYEFSPPAGTVHAITWVWVDALNSTSERLSPPYINIAERDVTAPTVSLRSALPNITRSAIGLAFDLNYEDDLSFVDISSLRSSLEVRGPTGKAYPIDFYGIGEGGNGNNLLTLKFMLSPPDFSWSQEPLGDYEIWVTESGIRDSSGNANSTQRLGGFKLTAPAARTFRRSAAVSK